MSKHRLLKIILFVVACGAVAFFEVGVYRLFHGYYDHGEFEIKQVQWASSKQVAMLAERSDREALGGLEYFVLVGNHVFSSAELRHALYSDAVVFRANSTCLDLRWESPKKLVIACKGSTVDADDIDVQKQQSGGIAISYKNITIK